MVPRTLPGRPSGLKGSLTRSLRDGPAGPPLTPEPLRPGGQAIAGRHRACPAPRPAHLQDQKTARPLHGTSAVSTARTPTTLNIKARAETPGCRKPSLQKTRGTSVADDEGNAAAATDEALAYRRAPHTTPSRATPRPGRVAWSSSRCSSRAAGATSAPR